MDHEYADRRQAIRATLLAVEMYLLALGDVGEQPCDCRPVEVRYERMSNGQIDIVAVHERMCRITINESVAAMEAGLTS
jgi:hypothetical protein